jgi:endonuclease III related protein
LTEAERTRSTLTAIHDTLLTHYGPQAWWPTRTGTAWEIMLGAILTQRTSWTNVERSLANMEAEWGAQALTDPELILRAGDEDLVRVLRPTGHFSTKPRKLRILARFVLDEGGPEAMRASGEPTEELRDRLLSLWGIGPETADAILLYALGRAAFVADAYALRLASRWGLLQPNAGYNDIQRLFTDHLPGDTALFNEYHALIVTHGKELCRPRPLCDLCPLNQPISLDVSSSETGSWRCPRRYTPW